MDENQEPKTSAEELVTIIQGVMEATGANPQDCMTALGQMLTTISLAMCDYHGNTHEIHETVTNFLNKIHGIVNDHINEHRSPEEADSEYMSFEQIREQTKNMAEKLNENEADRQARVNACHLIMDVDNYGFLLLACMKDNNVTISTNLQDEATRDNMLGILRETLYGSGQKSFRIQKKNNK